MVVCTCIAPWPFNHHSNMCIKTYCKFFPSYVANNPDWKIMVKQNSCQWAKVVSQWLSVKEFPVLFVGYENLMKDRYTELKRMLDFIGYPYSEDDLLCTVKSSGEGFHRNHTKKYLINPYSPELQKFVLSQIKKVDANLRKHNIFLYHHYTI